MRFSNRIINRLRASFQFRIGMVPKALRGAGPPFFGSLLNHQVDYLLGRAVGREYFSSFSRLVDHTV